MRNSTDAPVPSPLKNISPAPPRTVTLPQNVRPPPPNVTSPPLSPDLAEVLRPRWAVPKSGDIAAPVDEGARKRINLVLTKIIEMMVQPGADIPVKACKALENLATQPKNATVIALSGISRDLIPLLHRPEPALQEQALKVVCLLAEETAFTEDFTENKGLPPLVSLVASSIDAVALAATRVVTCLACNSALLEPLRQVGLHQVLVPLLRPNKQDLLRLHATWALSRLLVNEGMRSEFITAGGAQPLLTLALQQAALTVARAPTVLYTRSILALAAVFLDPTPQIRTVLTRAGTISKLVGLLGTAAPNFQIQTLQAIERIAKVPELRELAFAENTVGKLLGLLRVTVDGDASVCGCALAALAPLLESDTGYQAFCQLGGLEQVLQIFNSNRRATVLTGILSLLIVLCKRPECAQTVRNAGIPHKIVNILSPSQNQPPWIYGDAGMAFASLDKNLIADKSGELGDPKIEATENDLKIAAATFLLSLETDAQVWQDLSADQSEQYRLVSSLNNLIQSTEEDVRIAGLRLAALLALAGLVNKPTRFAECMRECGAIPSLVGSMLSQNPQARHVSAVALAWLTSDAECRTHIFHAQGLDPMISLLLHPLPDLQERILWALSNFALDGRYQKAVVDSGGVVPVVRFLLPPHHSDPILSNTMKIILILSQNPDYRRLLVEAGALDGLQNSIQSHNKTIQMAAQRALAFLQQ